MIELLVATTNPGKLGEVQAFLRELPLRIIPLGSLADIPAVIEDGQTFEENALKKARTLAQFSGLPTLADDSGLEVDALNGAPGIYSSRYAGADGNDVHNNQKLLRELENIPENRRTARFVCALALCVPGTNGVSEWTARESCEGSVGLDLRGSLGFGYDPLFFYPPFGKTFGEITREEKATVSHRGKALQKLAENLTSLLAMAAKP